MSSSPVRCSTRSKLILILLYQLARISERVRRSEGARWSSCEKRPRADLGLLLPLTGSPPKPPTTSASYVLHPVILTPLVPCLSFAPEVELTLILLAPAFSSDRRDLLIARPIVKFPDQVFFLSLATCHDYVIPCYRIPERASRTIERQRAGVGSESERVARLWPVWRK